MSATSENRRVRQPAARRTRRRRRSTHFGFLLTTRSSRTPCAEKSRWRARFSSCFFTFWFNDCAYSVWLTDISAAVRVVVDTPPLAACTHQGFCFPGRCRVHTAPCVRVGCPRIRLARCAALLCSCLGSRKRAPLSDGVGLGSSSRLAHGHTTHRSRTACCQAASQSSVSQRSRIARRRAGGTERAVYSCRHARAVAARSPTGAQPQLPTGAHRWRPAPAWSCSCGDDPRPDGGAAAGAWCAGARSTRPAS